MPKACTLDGKVALVTGAATGMGRATAVLFAQNGAQVILADTNEAAAAVVAEIEHAGGSARFQRTDLSEENEVHELVKEIVDRFGRLDCAVNNAALPPDHAPIAEADLETFDRIIAVNLRAVLCCMKHEICAMVTSGYGGAVVNIGSVNSVRPQLGSAAYTAAKHGVIGLTKTGSLEYADQGIRVNAVLPGGIETPMLAASLAATGRDPVKVGRKLSSIGRLGRPEEVAAASLWLCSDEASFVTGHAMAVDGGYLSL